MKRLIGVLAVILMFFTLSGVVSADQTIKKTARIIWTQPSGGFEYIKEWRLFESYTPGPPYSEQPVLTIQKPADAAVGEIQGSGSLSFSGPPLTTVKKYFVLRTCGDVPKEDGSTEFVCTGDSNEVEVSEWIPPGQFSVPVEVIITIIEPPNPN